MFRAIFSFQGRIGRLAFIGWMLAATALVFVISFSFLMLGSVTAGVFPVDGAGPRLLGVAMAVVAVTVGVWATVALQARRIRDMGCNPMPWMIGISVAMVADQWLLTPLTDLRFHMPLHQYTPVGGLLAFAYILMLLFWPGAADPAEAQASAEPAVDAPAQEPMPSLSAPSSALLLATPSQAAGRTQFGMPN